MSRAGGKKLSGASIEMLARALAKRRVVAVGESTHGTHEFFANRIELFKRLLSDQGFSVVAFEDREEACLKVNDYVHGAALTSTEAVSGLYSVWRTEEVRSFVEWLRTYSGRGGLVRFVGIDVDQATVQVSSQERDRHMAQRVLALARSQQVLVWAHNEHIRRSGVFDGYAPSPMGEVLRQRLEADYAAVAQFFGMGSFSAAVIDKSDPDNSSRELTRYTVKQPHPGSFEQLLAEQGADQMIDLNKTSYNNPLLVRSYGWGLVSARIDEHLHESLPSKEFSYVLYTHKTTATKPL